MLDHSAFGGAAEAWRAFPPLPRTMQVAPGYFTPARQVCRRRGPFLDCWLEGGYWVPPQFAEVDDNQPGRRQQTRACLFAQGCTGDIGPGPDGYADDVAVPRR